jgi:hypothetical protein
VDVEAFGVVEDILIAKPAPTGWWPTRFRQVGEPWTSLAAPEIGPLAREPEP